MIRSLASRSFLSQSQFQSQFLALTLFVSLAACATKDGPGRGPNDPNAASEPGSSGSVSNVNEVTKPSPGATHGVTGDPPEGNPQLDRPAPAAR